MIVSIFNDVIGPVMRGPSSSHCAAALRIGRVARDLMDGELNDLLVEFDRNGSLPSTHESQGSDMGLFGGLLGWDAAYERLPSAPETLRDAGVRIRIETVDAGDEHPNTYRLTLRNAREQHSLIGISTGGGMMEVIAVDGFKLSMFGDYHETLLWVEGDGLAVGKRLQELVEADEVLLHEAADRQLVEVKAARFVSDEALAALRPVRQVRGADAGWAPAQWRHAQPHRALRDGADGGEELDGGYRGCAHGRCLCGTARSRNCHGGGDEVIRGRHGQGAAG